MNPKRRWYMWRAEVNPKFLKFYISGFVIGVLLTVPFIDTLPFIILAIIGVAFGSYLGTIGLLLMWNEKIIFCYNKDDELLH